MKELVLIRHSYAESGSFSTPDFNRKLSPLGKEKARVQAEVLLNKNIKPDYIITSSANRAHETAQIFCNLLNAKCIIQQIPFLYEDFSTYDFFALINEINEKYSKVIIVGHNPTITIMASRIDIDALVSFNPCTMALFNMGASWKEAEICEGELIEVISL